MFRGKPSSLSPRPRKFVPAGEVAQAVLEFNPPFNLVKPKRRTGRKADGLRYERKVQERLTGLYPDQYVESPWLRFRERNCQRYRLCQPDGLLIDIRRGKITIVEIKLSHTAYAWWQTRQLYEPVVKALFGNSENPGRWKFAICEIVKWYDPDVVFPERYTLISDPCGVLPDHIGVHIWGGRGPVLAP